MSQLVWLLIAFALVTAVQPRSARGKVADRLCANTPTGCVRVELGLPAHKG